MLWLRLSLFSLCPNNTLIVCQVIKQFSACNCLTRHCAARCALCAMFTVQCGALYSLQWWAVFGVSRAVVYAASKTITY